MAQLVDPELVAKYGKISNEQNLYEDNALSYFGRNAQHMARTSFITGNATTKLMRYLSAKQSTETLTREQLHSKYPNSVDWDKFGSLPDMEADWLHNEYQERAQKEQRLAAYHTVWGVKPLLTLGSGFVAGMGDPAELALTLATSGLGKLAYQSFKTAKILRLANYSRKAAMAKAGGKEALRQVMRLNFLEDVVSNVVPDMVQNLASEAFARETARQSGLNYDEDSFITNVVAAPLAFFGFRKAGKAFLKLGVPRMQSVLGKKTTDIAALQIENDVLNGKKIDAHAKVYADLQAENEIPIESVDVLKQIVTDASTRNNIENTAEEWGVLTKPKEIVNKLNDLLEDTNTLTDAEKITLSGELQKMSDKIKGMIPLNIAEPKGFGPLDRWHNYTVGEIRDYDFATAKDAGMNTHIEDKLVAESRKIEGIRDERVRIGEKDLMPVDLKRLSPSYADNKNYRAFDARDMATELYPEMKSFLDLPKISNNKSFVYEAMQKLGRRLTLAEWKDIDNLFKSARVEGRQKMQAQLSKENGLIIPDKQTAQEVVDYYNSRESDIDFDEVAEIEAKAAIGKTEENKVDVDSLTEVDRQYNEYKESLEKNAENPDSKEAKAYDKLVKEEKAVESDFIDKLKNYFNCLKE